MAAVSRLAEKIEEVNQATDSNKLRPFSSFGRSCRRNFSTSPSLSNGDLYILDTNCALTHTIKSSFESSGYKVAVIDADDDSAIQAAAGYNAVCLFINKDIRADQVEILKKNGTKIVLHCSAGFNNSPTAELKDAGIAIYRVPSYSPPSIAEFAIGGIFALTKKVQMSYVNSKKADFRIDQLECLLLETRTCGVIGTGNIGQQTAEKIAPLVKKVYCYDAFPNAEWIKKIPNAEYADMDTVLRNSNMISVHVPLFPETHHLLNEEAFAKMQDNVVIVNTSRGPIVHIPSLIKALDSGKVFGAALDVFEGEKAYIFQDNPGGFAADPDLEKLASYDNVILSSHIAFYTDQAIKEITDKTLHNYNAFLGKEEKDPLAIVNDS